jgi:6-phosphogluconolactonase
MNKLSRALLLSTLAVGISSPSRTFAQEHEDGSQRVVFAMTNNANHNEVLSFLRAPNGQLLEGRHFATGGRGSGGTIDPLGSQGSLLLSQDGQHLFAVNAGSGDISVFRVFHSELVLTDREPSGGSEPVAIAQHGDLLYALNAAGGSNVSGFHVHQGRLIPIENSARFLTNNEPGGASISFSPDGKFLAVTEKQTNNLDVFSVQVDGTLSSIKVTPSVGPGIFSVLFAPNGFALVSETGPSGATNGSAISSYQVQADGTLTPVTTSAPTLGAANCWNAVTPDGRFVYVSNAGSATISGFSIAANGTLTPLPGTVVGANPSGATNLDITVSSDTKFLYSLNSGDGTIGVFAIQKDGQLVNIGPADGISPAAGFNGIAAN